MATQQLPWGPVENLSDTENEEEEEEEKKKEKEKDEEKEEEEEEESDEQYDPWIINTASDYSYADVDEDAIVSSPAPEKGDDDKDFAFSPASPPPTPPPTTTSTTSTTTTRSTSTAPTLYVLPNSTIVLSPDGGCKHIPDQRTITPPKPSTSTADDDEEDRKPSTSTANDDERQVCSHHIQIQNNIVSLIARKWRTSAPSTIEDTTLDVSRDVAFSILAASYQNMLMNYVRCAIGRPDEP